MFILSIGQVDLGSIKWHIIAQRLVKLQANDLKLSRNKDHTVLGNSVPALFRAPQIRHSDFFSLFCCDRLMDPSPQTSRIGS